MGKQLKRSTEVLIEYTSKGYLLEDIIIIYQEKVLIISKVIFIKLEIFKNHCEKSVKILAKCGILMPFTCQH